MSNNLLKAKLPSLKREELSGRVKTQILYYAMAIVPILWIMVFHYLPMVGLRVGFANYTFKKGVFDSEWVGLKWFMQVFRTYDFKIMMRNTLLYNITRILLVDMFCGVVFALLLYEIKGKVSNKIFHTCMLLPAFLSWTVVAACLLLFGQPDTGMLNSVLESLGMERINIYREKEYWPYIITIAKIYKNSGFSSIYFYSALLSIDNQLFDAAKLDGANRLQQIRHISLPAIRTVFCITLISSLGGVLGGAVSPNYELIRGSTVLNDTTLTLGLYLRNSITTGSSYSFAQSTAVGLMQSVIGVILVTSSNAVIRKINSADSLF